MRTRTIATAVLLFLFTTALVTAQQTAADLFRQGSAKEQVGDYEGAIPLYERIVREFTSLRDREQVAKAKLHLGDCWMKKTEADQAKGLALLNDVIDNYKDLTDLANEAKRLTALTRPAASPDTPLQIVTSFTEDSFSFAISPNGRSLVTQATAEDGKKQLWQQPVDGSKKPQAIAGTEGAGLNALPFFSPDGKSLGFFADGKLKRVSASGGIPQDLAVGTTFRGGTWNKNDVIVFSTESSVLYSIKADGSGQKAVTTNSGTSQISPKFLPDGNRFLFILGNYAQAILSLGGLDNASQSAIQPREAQSAAFVSPDRMVYVTTGGALMAQRVDPLKAQMIGDSVLLSPRVAVNRSWPGIAALSVSDAGPVAFRTAAAAYRQFKLVDRAGHPIRNVGGPDNDSPSAARISPDGRVVSFNRRGVGNPAVGSMWVRDIDGGVPRQLSAAANSAIWSPSSGHMALGEFARGVFPPQMDLFDRTSIINNAGRYLELRSGAVKADDWSSKDFLLYERSSSAAAYPDLMAVPVSGGAPMAVAQTPAAERNGRFSPDGSWVVYQSNELKGLDEVFVQPFPGSMNSRKRVSLNGGSFPHWSPDGLQIYFLSADHHLMVVPAPRSANGQDILLGQEKSLFPLPSGSEFEVAGEESFLIIAPIESAPPIFVLSNWADKLPAVSSSSPSSPLIVPAPLGRPSVYGAQTQIVVFDGQRQILSTIRETGPAPRLSISPDAAQVAYLRSGDFWVHDIAADSENRIASNVSAGPPPAWSPSGSRIAYLASRNGVQGVYVKASDGTGNEELLYAPVSNLFNWSKDERFLAITTGNNFAVLPVDGDRKPVSIMPTVGKLGMRLAPEGRLVAYLSNESGRNEVYVRTFDPASGGQPSGTAVPRKISTQGSAGMIRWSADGSELYYLASDGGVMAVPVAGATAFGEQSPTLLFRSPDNFPLTGTPGIYGDVSGDGQGFVFALPAATTAGR